MPVLVSANFIPCGGHIYDTEGNIKGEQKPCDLNFLLEMVDKIITWIIMISIPVAAGVFAWAGILYMTTGIAGKKEEAKKILIKVFWGLVFILASWLIVTTITNTLLSDDFRESVPIEGV